MSPSLRRSLAAGSALARGEPRNAERNDWTWIDPWPFVRAADGSYVVGVSLDGIHPSKQVEMRVGTILRGEILATAIAD